MLLIWWRENWDRAQQECLPLLHGMYAGLGYRILFPHSYTWSPSQDSLESWSLAKHGSPQQWGKGSEVGGGNQPFKG